MRSVSWITLPAIGRTLRGGYMLPLVLAALFFVLACIYLWVATPLYEARITITARILKSSALPEFGDLPLDLLGGLGKSQRLTSYDKLIEIIQSEDVAERLMSSGDLLARMFPDTWDAKAHEWKRPAGLLAGVRNILYRIFGLPGWTQPGPEPVLDLLADRLRVIPNDLGNAHTLMMYDPDPKVAHDALVELLASADRLLRDRDRKTNLENIEFFRSKLLREEIVDVREVLSRRLGEEFVNGAILASSSSYSYEILKDLSVSSRPVSPRPLLSLVLSVFAGLIVGSGILILMRREWVAPQSVAQRAA